jgi:hypothetical protein
MASKPIFRAIGLHGDDRAIIDRLHQAVQRAYGPTSLGTPIKQHYTVRRVRNARHLMFGAFLRSPRVRLNLFLAKYRRQKA